MPEFDLTTIGESLIRLSAPPDTLIESVTRFDVDVVGSESNFARALAMLGRKTAWCSRLPENPLGKSVANSLGSAGVDVSLIEWSASGRIGICYDEIENRSSSTRLFDRANSCATKMRVDGINWSRVLSTRLLHLTGITPALSSSCREVIDEAVLRAKSLGVPISFDVNYHAELWPVLDARSVLSLLVAEVEFLFIKQRDAEIVFEVFGSPEQQLHQLSKLTNAKRILLTRNDGTIAWNGGSFGDDAVQRKSNIDSINVHDTLFANVIDAWLKLDE
ncbi:MAG TPA: sugar kinase [Tepidisphaeraceae bacterium]|nr:sugar kinase [Tepidisphaeraceae bacterium]